MSASLKLVCLNIEKDKHLDRILPFLSERIPDIFCVQELYESSIPVIPAALSGASCCFAPMTRRGRETPPQIQGSGIFSRVPVRAQRALYYKIPSPQLPESVQGDPSTYVKDDRMVIVCEVEKDGEIFRIATTHFTWTPDGNPSEAQRVDMKSLLNILDTMREFVLAGDFNTPRCGEMFAELSTRYKDDIPMQYTSSLDPDLHRAGPLEKMVDGIFSTPAYTVSKVEMVAGLSDHCALIATVART